MCSKAGERTVTPTQPRESKIFFFQEKKGKSTLTNGTQKLGRRMAETRPQDFVISILSKS